MLPLYMLIGAGGRTRTANLLITSQLLCQLSYTGNLASKIDYTKLLNFVN